MKNKLLSLSLLALTLLGSCSSKVLSKEEYTTLGNKSQVSLKHRLLQNIKQILKATSRICGTLKIIHAH